MNNLYSAAIYWFVFIMKNLFIEVELKKCIVHKSNRIQKKNEITVLLQRLQINSGNLFKYRVTKKKKKTLLINCKNTKNVIIFDKKQTKNRH